MIFITHQTPIVGWTKDGKTTLLLFLTTRGVKNVKFGLKVAPKEKANNSFLDQKNLSSALWPFYNIADLAPQVQLDMVTAGSVKL